MGYEKEVEQGLKSFQEHKRTSSESLRKVRAS